MERKASRLAKMTSALAGAICLMTFSAPAPSRNAKQAPAAPKNIDRYVSSGGSDASDGSEQHPWATINRAGSLATPGTVVHVAPGTYREAVTTSSSGTEISRISYVSEQPYGAVIAPSGRDGFAWRNTGDYSDITGFEIAGTRCGGIGLGGSFQSAVSNNVHNTAAGCNTSDGGSGINDFNYNTQGNEILNNYIHDVGASEPHCGELRHAFIHGIYQANAGGRIDHNVSVNNCAFGIHLWHAATHATITNNTVVGNKASGILVGSGDAPCSTTGCPGNDYTVVRNNIVAFNGNAALGGWGLGENSQEPGGRNGFHNEYSNNLSFQNVSGDFYLPPSKPCRNCITGRDPKFVSMSTGDYRLQPDSPAAGAGDPQVAVKQNPPAKPQRQPPDIGAMPVAATTSH